MNEVSVPAMRAMMAQETSEIFLSFLQIQHPTLSTPILLVCNYEPITRSDGVYQPFAFNAPSPSQEEDGKVPQTTISIDNTDLEILTKLRTIKSPPKVVLFTALASSPDIIEEGPFIFDLQSVDGDESSLSGKLSYDGSVFDQNFPAQTYTPSNSPGLFV